MKRKRKKRVGSVIYDFTATAVMVMVFLLMFMVYMLFEVWNAAKGSPVLVVTWAPGSEQVIRITWFLELALFWGFVFAAKKLMDLGFPRYRTDIYEPCLLAAGAAATYMLVSDRLIMSSLAGIGVSAFLIPKYLIEMFSPYVLLKAGPGRKRRTGRQDAGKYLTAMARSAVTAAALLFVHATCESAVHEAGCVFLVWTLLAVLMFLYAEQKADEQPFAFADRTSDRA